MSGMAQPKLNQRWLNSINVPFPSLSQQQVIVGKLGRVATYRDQLAMFYQQQLLALPELKQSLLQKAFAGELTADTERDVEDALA